MEALEIKDSKQHTRYSPQQFRHESALWLGSEFGCWLEAQIAAGQIQSLTRFSYRDVNRYGNLCIARVREQKAFA